MLTGSAPKRHSACLASAVERCFRLLPRDLRWSALSTPLEAQMITGKTAVSLVARGGTDCAVSPVHNVFDAPPCRALDVGAALLDRALLIDPNLARGWLHSGWSKVWLGDPERAIEHFVQAIRLSPIDPRTFFMQEGIAVAHFFAGRHVEALSWAKMALRELPDSHGGLRIAAASCALVGRDEEAKKLIERLLEIDPALRISRLLQNVLGPYRHPEHAEKYANALRKAGLPE